MGGQYLVGAVLSKYLNERRVEVKNSDGPWNLKREERAWEYVDSNKVVR